MRNVLANFSDEIGLEEKILPQNARVGSATMLAALGYSEEQIRLFGHWNSDAFRTYTKEHHAWKKKAATDLANFNDQ